MEPPEFAVTHIAQAFGAGEPTVVADRWGNVLVTGPGGIQGFSYSGDHASDASVFESIDGGATWFVHNQPPYGQLTSHERDSTTIEGHLAIDDVGHRYLFDMVSHEAPTAGGAGPGSVNGGKAFRSAGPAEPWEFLGELALGDFDRPWVAAEGNGHVLLTWNGKGIPMLESHDAGLTWSSLRHLCGECSLPGPPVFDRLGRAAIPVFLLGGGPPDIVAEMDASIAVLAQDKTGAWHLRPSGAVAHRPFNAGAFPTNIIIVAAATDDGHLVVVWSQNDSDPSGNAAVGTSVWAVTSPDWGETWGHAFRISSRANAIFPWIAAGGGDRFAVVSYTTNTPGPPGNAFTASWDVMVSVVDGAAEESPRIVESVVEAAVHFGSICTSGNACVIGDRYTLADFISVATLPDGRLVVAYIVDGGDDVVEPVLRNVNLSRQGLLHVAFQTSGTPLFYQAPA